jgi:hypothetical protein
MAQEVDMGRYVFLLVAPVIVGVLIAAGALVIDGLRQRRIDARRVQLEARRPAPGLFPADTAGREVSSEPTHRRIAS